jgi:transketolase
MKKVYLTENIYDRNIQKVSTREGYGQGLVELGKRNRNVVVLCADLSESTKADMFKEKFPDRYIEVGVAEQNLVTVASGLAAAGKIPFASSFAVFMPGRCLEQIRTTICYNNANVKLAGAHAGVNVGADGATHQALEDIATMRALPNMVVVAPCDVNETRKATVALAKIKKPAYIRFAREKTPVFTTERTPFKLGRAEVFRDGSDVAIIACGPILYQAMLAARSLEKQKISAMVINNHTIKPLDEDLVLKAAKRTGCIVTAEDHQVTGGLGGAVAEFLSEKYPVPVVRVGVRDKYGESGSADELIKKFGLTDRDIVMAVRGVLKLK